MSEVVDKLRGPLEHTCFQLGRDRTWRDDWMHRARTVYSDTPKLRRNSVSYARESNHAIVRNLRLLRTLRSQP